MGRCLLRVLVITSTPHLTPYGAVFNNVSTAPPINYQLREGLSMLYVHTNITFGSFNNSVPIGSANIEGFCDEHYQPAEQIPYSADELAQLDTKKKLGVLYVEVK